MNMTSQLQIQKAYQWLGCRRVVLWPVTTPYEMLHPYIQVLVRQSAVFN
jgi:hypothetical protein